MAIQPKKDESEKADDLSLEVIIQRIFREGDPAAHRAAIWELFTRSGDWELFERLSEYGGEQGIATYFQNTLNYIDGLDETEVGDSDLPVIPAENREQIKELYASPLICLRRGDWAGSAAAMHEILLNEVYEIYQIDEDALPFGDATASSLEKWVSEMVLFPMSLIEYLAYSDCLTENTDPALLNNYLTLLLTLFFSAQAHLDIEESQRGPGFSAGEED